MKEYLVISGVATGLNGLSQDKVDEFIDKLVDLAESYDMQLALSFELKSEDELEGT